MVRYLRSPSGQALADLLIVGTLLGIVFSGMLSMGKYLTKSQQQANSTFQIDLTRRRFVATLQNGNAWNRTLNDSANASLACLRNRTDCAGRGGPIRVVDGAGNALDGYDPLAAPGNGFNAGGTPCIGFSPSPRAGSDACPFRLALSWQPVCPAVGTCIAPTARVIGKWIYNPGTPARTIAFNSANYDFALELAAGSPATFVFASADGTQALIAYGPPAAVPVQFRAAASDAGGEFDGTYFRPRQNGIYSVSFNTSIGPRAWNGGGCVGQLIVTRASGASANLGVSASYPTGGPTNLCTGTGTHAVALTVGDRVWVQIYHTAGAGAAPPYPSVTITGGGYTTFSASRLQ